MTTLREAAQQALDVMSDISSFERWSEAKDALRAALAEPVRESEPVASIYVTLDGDREFDDWRHDLPVGTNLLYTAPVGCPNCALLKAELEQRHLYQPVLTDEIIADLWYQNGTYHHHFARAIERYLTRK